MQAMSMRSASSPYSSHCCNALRNNEGMTNTSATTSAASSCWMPCLSRPSEIRLIGKDTLAAKPRRETSMSHYLFIQSQDPFADARATRQYELAIDLKKRGNDVTVVLVQNGVIP